MTKSRVTFGKMVCQLFSCTTVSLVFCALLIVWGCSTKPVPAKVDVVLNTLSRLNEQPRIAIGHYWGNVFQLPNEQMPGQTHIGGRSLLSAVLDGAVNALYQKAQNVRGVAFRQSLSLIDPTQQVKDRFALALKTQLGLENLHVITNVIDSREAFPIQDPGLAFMFKTRLWGFEAPPEEYKQFGVWDSVKIDLLGTYFFYEVEASLLSIPDHQILLSYSCYFDTNGEDNIDLVRLSEYMADGGRLLRDATNKAADRCSEELIARFLSLVPNARR